MTNACPFCRKKLIEEEVSPEWGELSEEEDDVNDDEIYREEGVVTIEELTRVYEKHGYTMRDLMSCMYSKYSPTDPIYTREHVMKLDKELDFIHRELYREKKENMIMRCEDIQSTVYFGL